MTDTCPRPRVYGYDVVVVPGSCLKISERVQFRFPRSKKKRIRKKWAKNPANFKTTRFETVYRLGNTLVVSPETMAEMQRQTMQDLEKMIFTQPDTMSYGRGAL